MERHYRTLDEIDIEHFQNHPEQIRGYLDVAFEESEKDDDWNAFFDCVRIVAKARGADVNALLAKCRPNDAGGPPPLNVIGTVLRGLGFKLSVQPAAIASEASQ